MGRDWKDQIDNEIRALERKLYEVEKQMTEAHLTGNKTELERLKTERRELVTSITTLGNI